MLICALGILTHSYQLNVTFAISCTISLFFLFSFFFPSWSSSFQYYSYNFSCILSSILELGTQTAALQPEFLPSDPVEHRGSKNLGSWLLFLAALSRLDKWESQGDTVIPASWPSSQRGSPPTGKVRRQHCPATPPLQHHNVEPDLCLPVLLLLGSLWGQGQPPQEGDSSQCPLCCLGCSEPGDIEAVSTCVTLQS